MACLSQKASGRLFAADDSLLPKGGDGRLGKTELPQNFLVVFTQPWRPTANEHGRLEPSRSTGLA